MELHLYNEVVISVKNLQTTAQIYTDLLGWDIVWQGKGTPSQTQFWGLPEICQSDEIVLSFQGLTYGKIRLIKFNNVYQQVIRSGGQAWDTGGILDIDLRVSDINWAYNEFTERGWHGYSQPVTQTMGPFTVQEVLLKGPDEVVIAFVHRQNPPHPNPFNLEGCTSPVYLSAMIVKDLAVAQDFFVNKLGFKLHNEIAFRGEEGRSMFGLPHNVAAQTNTKLSIIGPTNSRDALLDLVELEGIKGEDFSAVAVPPNRGILMYRFPVTDIESYAKLVEANGATLRCPLQTIELEPIGSVKQFAVQSPDGVWLEFWEKQ